MHNARSFARAVRWWLVGCGLILVACSPLAAPAETGSIGVARVDVTPDYPVRLTGFAARTNLGGGKLQALWAKAVALGGDEQGPRILVTVDNCGVPANVVEEVAGRLALKARIARENFVVASSHTHSGPMVRGFAENIFVRDLNAEELGAADRYTRDITDRIEAVALAALRDRRPGRLFRGETKVGFAANRRTPGGPVDHAVPVLVARDPDGRVRAVVANYACHCTTIGHQVNQCHGDWAGFAQEAIETDHPGAVALITIGCGADANPSPRGGEDFGVGLARRHGRALAKEVQWLVGGVELEPLPLVPRASYRRLELPFQALPTREEWEKRSGESGIVGYHARKNLARLNRGETLPTRLPYFVQTWSFGERLSMVFLAGEVVVDYALRLKREFDPRRLWITAYANDVPCYIPSRRILAEGGYEPETSLWYYDRPARLAGEVEDLIHAAVTNRLPPELRLAEPRAEISPPRSAEESLWALRTRPELKVELVAAEPLLTSPVAIDFGADGRLWVVEMFDYPSGLDGAGRPGGRVKVLTDRDGDGRFDEARLVADGLPFPTGLMAWGDGVLVCAAPDIVWVPASGETVHGVADPRARRLLTGFATHNYQARVNGLRWGMDGWVYGSGGLFGGRVTSLRTGEEFEASGRDFRWQPDTGEFEPLAGVSQQGRVRDDFGEWFGNDNSTLLWHFPMADRYGRRNPLAKPPEPRAMANRGDNRVYPFSQTLERFNDPQARDHLTSVCGPEIYRDSLLGEGYAGNAFVCEPVHNLVRRAILTPEGASFGARRAADETDREFLSSSDNWFRPVEVRTGPDGALWVVDMYRAVVEHPRWIPPERLRSLDVRAGADRGRIYRVHPKGVAPRRIRDLAALDAEGLVQALGSPNGVERDLVQRLLASRTAGAGMSESGVERGAALARDSTQPAGARVQAAFTLAQAGRLSDAVVSELLRDRDARVVRAVLPLAEGRDGAWEAMEALRLRAMAGNDEGLLFQVALSLGAWKSPAAARALAELAPRMHEPRLRAAWLSSATTPASSAAMAVTLGERSPLESEAVASLGVLLQTLVAMDGTAEFAELLGRWLPSTGMAVPPDRWGVLLPFAETWVKDARWRECVAKGDPTPGRATVTRLETEVLPQAMRALENSDGAGLPESAVPVAVRILGERAMSSVADQELLLRLLERPGWERFRGGVREALGRCGSPAFARLVLSGWARRGPAARSTLVGLLLDREAFQEELGRAIDAGAVQAQELDTSQRRRLLEHLSDELRGRLAGRLEAPKTERGAVLAAYAGVAEMTGQPARGKAHFDRLCSVCHRLRGRGNEVGPDLLPFAAKPVGDYLVAILDPNAAIDPRYLAYEVAMADGRELSGVVRAETGTTLTLGQAGGTTEVLRRADIRELRAQGKSLMPDGLEQGMAPQDLADLIAWLKQGLPAS